MGKLLQISSKRLILDPSLGVKIQKFKQYNSTCINLVNIDRISQIINSQFRVCSNINGLRMANLFDSGLVSNESNDEGIMVLLKY